MVQTATVKRTDGKLAEIEVSRKAMCDGCHNTNCGAGCPMSGLFSSGKSMTASAVNKIGAVAGNRVEIETSDREVLATAVAVFVLPVITGGIFFSLASYFGASSVISAISAVIGFAIPFPFLKIIENTARNKDPKIIIKRILPDNNETV